MFEYYNYVNFGDKPSVAITYLFYVDKFMLVIYF